MNDDLQAKIEKLERELAELKEQTSQQSQQLSEDDEYYFVESANDASLYVESNAWGDGSMWKSELLKRGNVFKNYDEAVEVMKAIKRLMRLRIMTGGIGVEPTGYMCGSFSFAKQDEGRLGATDEYNELFRCLKVLLRHYPADDMAKKLFEEEEK